MVKMYCISGMEEWEWENCGADEAFEFYRAATQQHNPLMETVSSLMGSAHSIFQEMNFYKTPGLRGKEPSLNPPLLCPPSILTAYTPMSSFSILNFLIHMKFVAEVPRIVFMHSLTMVDVLEKDYS